MPLPVVEALGWVVLEFIAAFFFYNTGALILRALSLGNKRYPLCLSTDFKKDIAGPKAISLCYGLGILFYSLVALSLIVLYSR